MGLSKSTRIPVIQLLILEIKMCPTDFYGVYPNSKS